MHQYNPQKYHRRSIRLQGYDYSEDGLYFITICCQDRVHLFGEIVEKILKLNDAGIQAQECWLDIPNHFPNVVLHEFVIMPNHIHGIIEFVGAKNLSPVPPPNSPHLSNMMDEFSPDIMNQHLPVSDNSNEHSPNQPTPDSLESNIETSQPSSDNVDMKDMEMLQDENGVNGKNEAAMANEAVVGAKNFSPPPPRSPSKTIGSVVRGFKIGVTKWMRNNTNVVNVWQRNYYDHIIRNEKAYERISEYIKNNPIKWKEDRFYDKDI